MAENNTNANKNWQEWLNEQGLSQAPSTLGNSASDPQISSYQQVAAPAVVPATTSSAATTPMGAAPTTPTAATPTAATPTASAQTATIPMGAAPTASSPAAATPTATTPMPTPAAATPSATTPTATTPMAAASTTQTTVAPTTPMPTATAAHSAADQKAAKRAAKQAAKQAAKANKSGGGFKTFALGFLGAAAAFAIGSGVLGANGFLDRPTVTETVSEGGTVVLGSETNTAVAAADNHTESLAEAVADKVLPSVVGIDVYANYSSGYSSFWGGGSTDSETLAGLGSGVIISKDGYILTNYHVVEGASKLMVNAGGEEREATVVGTDESSDLAVIKVDATDLTPVEIGSSDNLKPGQWVMTLGSPFGLEQSVATGIISATSRTVVVQNSDSLYSYGQQVQPSIYSNMIQTDAAINPGNSGGALVDENGKLIGINSVIESYSGSYSGVGFAIPVDYAMNIATQIIDGKTPTHAQLGVSATTVDKEIAERYGMSVNAGAYINKVYDDSGAQAAGLEQGDIITKINGVAIESSTDLIGQVRAHNVGETVTVTIVRETETIDIEVTLGSDEDAASYSEEYQQQVPNGGYHNWGNGGGQDGGGYDWSDLFGDNGEDGHGFSYEDLEELFNYFNR